jgi:YggT family protein
MGAMFEIGNLLVKTFFYLYLLIAMLRLILQLAKADFYNPISQFIVKATNPLLMPLRKIIPGFFGIDMASVVLILLVQLLAMVLIILLAGYALPNPLQLIMWAVIACLGMITNMYFFAILGSIIISWVAPGSYNPLVLLLHQLTEPVMAPFRKILPAMGGLDLSPIFVFLTINIVQIIIRTLAANVGLQPWIAIGL